MKEFLQARYEWWSVAAAQHFWGGFWRQHCRNWQCDRATAQFNNSDFHPESYLFL
jgi:hypothetical protein